MQTSLYASTLHSLPLLGRGKVRENYALGDDRILMVTSDRISAFDVVMAEPIPGKGEVLTRMALAWFDLLAGIVPKSPDRHRARDRRAGRRGRSGARAIDGGQTPEAVADRSRGPRLSRRFGLEGLPGRRRDLRVALPKGLRNAEQLAAPIFTAATKADLGEHDENIDFDAVVRAIGPDLAERVRVVSVALYRRASEHAATRGILIADTKFEFGLDDAGTLTLMDEVLTAEFVALLAGRLVRRRAGHGPQPAELRQAVPARLPRVGPRLEQAGAGTAAAGRDRRAHGGQVSRGAAAPLRLTAACSGSGGGRAPSVTGCRGFVGRASPISRPRRPGG